MADWLQRYVDAVRAAYPSTPPDIAAYLDTFDAESSANHEARDQVWQDMPADLRARLIDLMRQANPQLFN